MTWLRHFGRDPPAVRGICAGEGRRPVHIAGACPRRRSGSAAAGPTAASAAGRRRGPAPAPAPAGQRHGRQQLDGVGVTRRAGGRLARRAHRPVHFEGVAAAAAAKLIARHALKGTRSAVRRARCSVEQGQPAAGQPLRTFTASGCSGCSGGQQRRLPAQAAAVRHVHEQHGHHKRSHGRCDRQRPPIRSLRRCSPNQCPAAIAGECHERYDDGRRHNRGACKAEANQGSQSDASPRPRGTLTHGSGSPWVATLRCRALPSPPPCSASQRSPKIKSISVTSGLTNDQISPISLKLS